MVTPLLLAVSAARASSNIVAPLRIWHLCHESWGDNVEYCDLCLPTQSLFPDMQLLSLLVELAPVSVWHSRGLKVPCGTCHVQYLQPSRSLHFCAHSPQLLTFL